MFGHCAENRTGRQIYVLHTLCPFFEEMDAVGCGSPGIACKHRKEGLWTKAGNGSQSYVLCNVCPFFEEMHALGGGGPYSGIAAWALLARHMKTRNATHTGRRACGQRPEMKARATFYLGGGGSCLGTAPKTELVARATFYTIFWGNC